MSGLWAENVSDTESVRPSLTSDCIMREVPMITIRYEGNYSGNQDGNKAGIGIRIRPSLLEASRFKE